MKLFLKSISQKFLQYITYIVLLTFVIHGFQLQNFLVIAQYNPSPSQQTQQETSAISDENTIVDDVSNNITQDVLLNINTLDFDTTTTTQTGIDNLGEEFLCLEIADTICIGSVETQIHIAGPDMEEEFGLAEGDEYEVELLTCDDSCGPKADIVLDPEQIAEIYNCQIGKFDSIDGVQDCQLGYDDFCNSRIDHLLIEPLAGVYSTEQNGCSVTIVSEKPLGATVPQENIICSEGCGQSLILPFNQRYKSRNNCSNPFDCEEALLATCQSTCSIKFNGEDSSPNSIYNPERASYGRSLASKVASTVNSGVKTAQMITNALSADTGLVFKFLELIGADIVSKWSDAAGDVLGQAGPYLDFFTALTTGDPASIGSSAISIAELYTPEEAAPYLALANAVINGDRGDVAAQAAVIAAKHGVKDIPAIGALVAFIDGDYVKALEGALTYGASLLGSELLKNLVPFVAAGYQLGAALLADPPDWIKAGIALIAIGLNIIPGVGPLIGNAFMAIGNLIADIRFPPDIRGKSFACQTGCLAPEKEKIELRELERKTGCQGQYDCADEAYLFCQGFAPVSEDALIESCHGCTTDNFDPDGREISDGDKTETEFLDIEFQCSGQMCGEESGTSILAREVMHTYGCMRFADSGNNYFREDWYPVEGLEGCGDPENDSDDCLYACIEDGAKKFCMGQTGEYVATEACSAHHDTHGPREDKYTCSTGCGVAPGSEFDKSKLKEKYGCDSNESCQYYATIECINPGRSANPDVSQTIADSLSHCIGRYDDNKYKCSAGCAKEGEKISLEDVKNLSGEGYSSCTGRHDCQTNADNRCGPQPKGSGTCEVKNGRTYECKQGCELPKGTKIKRNELKDNYGCRDNNECNILARKFCEDTLGEPECNVNHINPRDINITEQEHWRCTKGCVLPEGRKVMKGDLEKKLGCEGAGPCRPKAIAYCDGQYPDIQIDDQGTFDDFSDFVVDTATTVGGYASSALQILPDLETIFPKLGLGKVTAFVQDVAAGSQILQTAGGILEQIGSFTLDYKGLLSAIHTFKSSKQLVNDTINFFKNGSFATSQRNGTCEIILTNGVDENGNTVDAFVIMEAVGGILQFVAAFVGQSSLLDNAGGTGEGGWISGGTGAEDGVIGPGDSCPDLETYFADQDSSNFHGAPEGTVFGTSQMCADRESILRDLCSLDTIQSSAEVSLNIPDGYTSSMIGKQLHIIPEGAIQGDLLCNTPTSWSCNPYESQDYKYNDLEVYIYEGVQIDLGAIDDTGSEDIFDDVGGDSLIGSSTGGSSTGGSSAGGSTIDITGNRGGRSDVENDSSATGIFRGQSVETVFEVQSADCRNITTGCEDIAACLQAEVDQGEEHGSSDECQIIYAPRDGNGPNVPVLCEEMQVFDIPCERPSGIAGVAAYIKNTYATEIGNVGVSSYNVFEMDENPCEDICVADNECLYEQLCKQSGTPDPDCVEVEDEVDEDVDGGSVLVFGNNEYFADADRDGYGDDDDMISAPVAPDGYVEQGGDCDDSSMFVYPGRVETCDGLDNNCDGQIDNGIPGGCDETGPIDSDNDGYASDMDCDDNDPSIHPGVIGECDDLADPSCDVQICNDYVDNDCDGYVDECSTQYDPDGYEDTDGDGVLNGADIHPDDACLPLQQPGYIGYIEYEGRANELWMYDDCDQDGVNNIIEFQDGSDPYKSNSSLCDINNTCDPTCDFDTNPDPDCDYDGDGYDLAHDCNDTPIDGVFINPGAVEICDDIDNNCDGEIDDIYWTWYPDADNDGYPRTIGNSTERFNGTCEWENDLPSDTSGLIQMFQHDKPWKSDCDDTNPNIHPDAIEIPDNDIDENCDFISEQSDIDDDGHIYDDCNPNDSSVYPGADEICDGLDNDCDGNIDGFAILNDNIGACAGTASYCSEGEIINSFGGGSDYVRVMLEGESYYRPLYVPTDEICNGIDDDCDGEVDELVCTQAERLNEMCFGEVFSPTIVDWNPDNYLLPGNRGYNDACETVPPRYKKNILKTIGIGILFGSMKESFESLIDAYVCKRELSCWLSEYGDGYQQINLGFAANRTVMRHDNINSDSVKFYNFLFENIIVDDIEITGFAYDRDSYIDNLDDILALTYVQFQEEIYCGNTPIYQAGDFANESQVNSEENLEAGQCEMYEVLTRLDENFDIESLSWGDRVCLTQCMASHLIDYDNNNDFDYTQYGRSVFEQIASKRGQCGNFGNIAAYVGKEIFGLDIVESSFFNHKTDGQSVTDGIIGHSMNTIFDDNGNMYVFEPQGNDCKLMDYATIPVYDTSGEQVGGTSNETDSDQDGVPYAIDCDDSDPNIGIYYSEYIRDTNGNRLKGMCEDNTVWTCINGDITTTNPADNYIASETEICEGESDDGGFYRFQDNDCDGLTPIGLNGAKKDPDCELDTMGGDSVAGDRTDPADDPNADADGDGYQSVNDCNDTDSDIHPGVIGECDELNAPACDVELCNDYVDNDCDGDVDECSTQYDPDGYEDTDGDGVLNGADTDPDDPCLPLQENGYEGFDYLNEIWAEADCDGDLGDNQMEYYAYADPYLYGDYCYEANPTDEVCKDREYGDKDKDTVMNMDEPSVAALSDPCVPNPQGVNCVKDALESVVCDGVSLGDIDNIGEYLNNVQSRCEVGSPSSGSFHAGITSSQDVLEDHYLNYIVTPSGGNIEDRLGADCYDYVINQIESMFGESSEGVCSSICAWQSLDDELVESPEGNFISNETIHNMTRMGYNSLTVAELMDPYNDIVAITLDIDGNQYTYQVEWKECSLGEYESK